MKCEICSKGVEEGALHRVNEKGVTGIWRHEKCGAKNIDSIVKEICDTIEEDNRK